MPTPATSSLPTRACTPSSPWGSSFPVDDRNDVQAAVEDRAQSSTPRSFPVGAGTSLCRPDGGGPALVLDFSRHMQSIVEIDPDARLARVQPGVVQDDLNRAVAEHGLLFAPDTSTANRATLGGMIGNNSCGARSARYGMTIDHVEALDVVLSDGSLARFEGVDDAEIDRRAGEQTLEGHLYREIPRLIQDRSDVIRDAVPPHWRRSGGYRLERLLPEGDRFSLADLVVGSEGTLAITVEATVRLVPKPNAVAALVGHFTSVDAAIEAVPPTPWPVRPLPWN
jgi:FAD/FMN-containing dehydrogenase